MVNYFITAFLLKFLSNCPYSKYIHRSLQQLVGKKRRTKQGFIQNYLNQAMCILELSHKFNIFRNNHRVLELGTGWTNWASIIIGLFFNDLEIWMFDIVDNRQFDVLKKYLIELRNSNLLKEKLSFEQKEYVYPRLNNLLKAKSFREIYQLLNLKYIVDKKGRLNSFNSDNFDVVISFDVLEHIHYDSITSILNEINRILKPGGYSIHQFDLGDHIAGLLKSNVSKKYYLKFSDKIWKRYFENHIIYMNRVQRSEWLNLFNNSHLNLVEEHSELIDIGNIGIDKKWKFLERKDLESNIVTFIHRKPFI